MSLHSSRANPRPRRPTRKLGLLTAAWQRPHLTEQVLEYYTWMRLPGWTLYPVCVTSPEDPDPHGPVDGWNYVTAPNDPLGKKWNTGLRVLRDADVDAVMVIGTDDLISSSYFDLVLNQLAKNAEVISCRDLFIYSPPDDVVAYCESMVPGAGRVVSRRALDAVKWKLWDDSMNAHLDSSVMSRLRQVHTRNHNVRNMGQRSFAILDIKREDQYQMWRLRKLDGSPQMCLRNDGGTELKIRKVTFLPAGRFFKDYFPMFTSYEELGAPIE